MKKLIIFMLVTVLTLFSCELNATTLSFSPMEQEISVGDIVSVDLYISDLISASISMFNVDVLWDPRRLRLSDVTFGDQLNLSGTESFTSVTPEMLGSVTLHETSYDNDDYIYDNQLGTFTLATLYFNSIKEGSSLLGTHDEVFGWIGVVPSVFNVPDTIDTMGRVNISQAAVPVPTSLLLLFSGIMLCVFKRRPN